MVDKYGPRVVFEARSRIDARLSSVIRGRDWHWFPAWSDNLVNIQSQLPLVTLGDKDTPMWLPRSKIYSSRDTWEAIQVKHPRIGWSKLIWFSFTIPKHAFFLWLTVKACLTTGYRHLKWGASGDAKCLFGRNYIETRDHLFFECGLSKRLWKAVMYLCLQLGMPMEWKQLFINL